MKKPSDISKEILVSLIISAIGFVAYFYFSIFPNLQAQVLLQDQKIDFIKEQLIEIKNLLKDIKGEKDQQNCSSLLGHGSPRA